MSVGRDVLARVLDIPEEDVRCDKCEYLHRLFKKIPYCTFWQECIEPLDGFCSAIAPKKENANDI